MPFSPLLYYNTPSSSNINDATAASMLTSWGAATDVIKQSRLCSCQQFFVVHPLWFWSERMCEVWQDGFVRLHDDKVNIFSPAPTTHRHTTAPFISNLFKLFNTVPSYTLYTWCWVPVEIRFCFIQAIKAPHTSFWPASRPEHLVLCFHWQFSFVLSITSSLSLLCSNRTVFPVWFTRFEW